MIIGFFIRMLMVFLFYFWLWFSKLSLFSWVVIFRNFDFSMYYWNIVWIIGIFFGVGFSFFFFFNSYRFKVEWDSIVVEEVVDCIFYYVVLGIFVYLVWIVFINDGCEGFEYLWVVWIVYILWDVDDFCV